jgi:hypothetical protein
LVLVHVGDAEAVVELILADDACTSDCILPRPSLERVLLQALRSEHPTLERVVLLDPRDEPPGQ